MDLPIYRWALHFHDLLYLSCVWSQFKSLLNVRRNCNHFWESWWREAVTAAKGTEIGELMCLLAALQLNNVHERFGQPNKHCFWERIALILTRRIFWPKALPKTYLSPNVLFSSQDFVLCGRSLLLQSLCVHFSGARQTRFNLFRFPLQQRINGNASLNLF